MKQLKKPYINEMEELLQLARCLGVNVQSKKIETFDLETFGIFDSKVNQITLFYEKEITCSAEEVFTLAHEIRHYLQYKSGLWPTYWYFDLGIGPKPERDVLQELEDDADRFAHAWLKGRGIRRPKSC